MNFVYVNESDYDEAFYKAQAIYFIEDMQLLCQGIPNDNQKDIRDFCKKNTEKFEENSCYYLNIPEINLTVLLATTSTPFLLFMATLSPERSNATQE